ncbi:hypothetical protein BR93DRAFT_925068 [Coniochaeta sp. PMI_546]|nr:hypothetical protein BR93DRAFT_925068 [Coniochaeta sp. PMI_546]
MWHGGNPGDLRYITINVLGGGTSLGGPRGLWIKALSDSCVRMNHDEYQLPVWRQKHNASNSSHQRGRSARRQWRHCPLHLCMSRIGSHLALDDVVVSLQWRSRDVWGSTRSRHFSILLSKDDEMLHEGRPMVFRCPTTVSAVRRRLQLVQGTRQMSREVFRFVLGSDICMGTGYVQ